MDNNWHEFYKKRINSGYQRYFEFRYAPFLLSILEEKPSRIVETGCGIGSVSKYLRNYDIDCIGFDICQGMVDLANKNLGDDIFHKGDIFNKPMASIYNEYLCISHGVLEHFSDKQIIEILNLYPNSIHYVPLEGYGYYGYSRPHDQRSYKKINTNGSLEVFSKSFILFDEVEKTIQFAIGDLIKPSGIVKSSANYNLTKLKKAKVLSFKNSWSKPKIQIEIIEGSATRPWGNGNNYHKAIKGERIIVFKDAFEKFVDENNRLNYSIF